MSKTDNAALTGTGAPVVHQVKQAMTGFVNEFKGLKADFQTKLQQTEERLTMLDRKSLPAARPHLAASTLDGAPHQKAFDAYVRSGDDDGLRGLELESKLLTTAVNGDGGYPVLIAEDMPDAASGSFSIAFGDFSAGYTIAERPDLRVLRDPFSAKPHVLFYATKRVGGDVSDFAAIKLVKFGTA